jgi:hypothetical protein
MQASLEQDTNDVIRLGSIDIRTGTTHEYAYQLTTGSGVGDIVQSTIGILFQSVLAAWLAE